MEEVSTKFKLIDNIELISIITGSMIGISILSLPNTSVKYARQNGWICPIIGAVYPLIMILLTTYIIKNYPNDDILTLSKKYFGNIIGTILNLCLCLCFIFYTTAVASGFSNVIRTYIMPFITPLQIFSVITLLAAYTSYRGMKVLGKLNKIIFYLSIVMVLIPSISMIRGSYMNLLPLSDIKIQDLFRGGIESVLSYAGLEVIFIVYPFIRNKNKFKKLGMISVIITMSIYTFIVVSTIYFLGYNMIHKNIWSFIMTTEGIDLPLINNFRFVFVFLWSLVMIKTMANHYYSSVYILNNVIGRNDMEEIALSLYPVVVYLSSKYGNEMERRAFIGSIVVKITIFTTSFVLIIVIMIYIEKLKKNKKRYKPL